MEPFTIYAEDGEYRETALSIEGALYLFHVHHPGLHPIAITSDWMRPRLVKEDAVAVTIQVLYEGDVAHEEVTWVPDTGNGTQMGREAIRRAAQEQ